MKLKTKATIGLLLAALAGATVWAGEFRGLKPIKRPGDDQTKKEFPEDGPAVPQSVVEQAVRDLAASWNTSGMQDTVGSGLYDGSRLGDAMDREVPRDARMTILAVEGARTLGHRRETGPDGQPRVVSRVEVAVRTQVELDHPTLGHQRIEGVNQMVVDITRAAREEQGR